MARDATANRAVAERTEYEVDRVEAPLTGVED